MVSPKRKMNRYNKKLKKYHPEVAAVLNKAEQNMKLFFYDTKHQQVIAQQEIGNLTETEVKLVNSVLEFLQDNLITDGRYKNLTLADDIETMYDDGEPQLIIRNAR